MENDVAKAKATELLGKICPLLEQPHVTDKMRILILLRIAKCLAESVLSEDTIAIHSTETAMLLVANNENFLSRMSIIATSAMKGVLSLEQQQALLVIKYAVNNAAKDVPFDAPVYLMKMAIGLEVLFSCQNSINWEGKLLRHIAKITTINK